MFDAAPKFVFFDTNTWIYLANGYNISCPRRVSRQRTLRCTMPLGTQGPVPETLRRL